MSRGIKGIGEIRLSLKLLRNLELIRPVIQKIIDKDLILLTHTSEPVGHLYPGKGDITRKVLYPFISCFPRIEIGLCSLGRRTAILSL